MNDTNEKYIAKTFVGLEEVLAAELRGLGAENIAPLRRGVAFTGNQHILYKANVWCRTAISVLKPLLSFSFDSKESFYEQVRQIPWTTLFSADKTIAVVATAHDSPVFNNTMFVAQLTKDAIADEFIDTHGTRPSVDTVNAHIRIVVNIQGGNCNVSIDSSGEALFKRGYRRAGGPAPINEVLAAGLIRLAEWDAKQPFYDPMCGSGTFSIEAAMMAANIAPGAERKRFGFSNWNDFDPGTLLRIQKEAAAQIIPVGPKIIASDIVGKMLDITRQNLMNAGLLGSILVQKNDFFSYQPKDPGGCLLLNPPYGHRMKNQDVRALYIHIGDTLKQRFAGFRAGIISADLDAMKHLGLKPHRKHMVYSGPLKCTFNVYDLFEGTRKAFVTTGKE